MNEPRRARVGLLGLMFDLYDAWPELKPLMLDFPYIPDLARPHYKFQPEGELCDFLSRFSLEGGSHHQALAYGHWAGTVQKIASIMGIACARV